MWTRNCFSFFHWECSHTVALWDLSWWQWGTDWSWASAIPFLWDGWGLGAGRVLQHRTFIRVLPNHLRPIFCSVDGSGIHNGSSGTKDQCLRTVQFPSTWTAFPMATVSFWACAGKFFFPRLQNSQTEFRFMQKENSRCVIHVTCPSKGMEAKIKRGLCNNFKLAFFPSKNWILNPSFRLGLVNRELTKNTQRSKV